ncbi:MAG TPA: hypothetical protein VFP70_08545 [Burkholderiales bacterium]|nr:hypothetical protein [Burkholderiales bacterium]
MREPPRRLRRKPVCVAIGTAALAWAGLGWGGEAQGPAATEFSLPPAGAPAGSGTPERLLLAAATVPGMAPAPAASPGIGVPPAVVVAPDIGAGSESTSVSEPLRFAQAPPAQGGGSAAPARGRQTDLLSSINWRLARPFLRWTGLVGVDYFIDKSEDLDARTFNAYTTLLGTADTYLWQPWFAQLRGSLGVSAFYNNTDSRDSGVGLVGGSPEQTTWAWNGGGSVGVFPFSRFPFEAYIDKADSRTDATLFDQTQDNLRMGVRQRYQTQRGDQSYAFSWDRSILNQTYTNVPDIEDTLDVFIINGSYGIANQSLAAGVQYDRNRRNDGYASDNFNAVAQHTWLPSARWNVNSVASLRNTEITQPPFSDTETQFAQLYSLANWLPDDVPVTAFGTLRYATNSSKTAFSETDGYDAAAAVAGSYYYNRNTTFSGSFTVNTSDTETFTNTVVSGYYGADVIPLAEWQYFWNVSGTVNNVAGGDAAGTSANAALAQTISRYLGQWWGGDTTVNANLGLGTTAGSGAFDSTSSANIGANMSWTRSFGSTQATASLSASDFITRGDIESDFLLVNAQATLSGQLSRYSAWNGNLTMQWTQESRDNPGIGPIVNQVLTNRIRTTQTYYNANLGYSHFRVFNVPRLVFTSNLRTYTNDVKRNEGNLLTALPVFAGIGTGDINETALEWDNRLLYNIGKTELELRAIVNTIDVDNVGATDRWQVGIRIIRRLGF